MTFFLTLLIKIWYTDLYRYDEKVNYTLDEITLEIECYIFTSIISGSLQPRRVKSSTDKADNQALT